MLIMVRMSVWPLQNFTCPHCSDGFIEELQEIPESRETGGDIDEDDDSSDVSMGAQTTGLFKQFPRDNRSNLAFPKQNSHANIKSIFTQSPDNSDNCF